MDSKSDLDNDGLDLETKFSNMLEIEVTNVSNVLETEVTKVSKLIETKVSDDSIPPSQLYRRSRRLHERSVPPATITSCSDFLCLT